MDWRSFNYALEYLASGGGVFSTGQKIAIKAALTVLQDSNRFEKVHFLGKIHGTENDYYLACGIGADYLKDRKYFYSVNSGTEWILLPQPSPLITEMGLSARGHFTGDPASDCDTDLVPDGSDELNEGDEWATIKEEDRLAATVADIMSEVAIVPRGALIKDSNGLVTENKIFEGLSKELANKLHSYYHLRRPINPWDRSIVCRADYNLSTDFLDSIASDLPLGCWSIQMDKYEKVVTLRSLYWPGLTAFHEFGCGCNSYGWLYIGTGKKNWDVPFMIEPLPPHLRPSVMEGGPRFQFADNSDFGAAQRASLDFPESILGENDYEGTVESGQFGSYDEQDIEDEEDIEDLLLEEE